MLEPKDVELAGGILNQYCAIEKELFRFKWKRLIPFAGEHIDFAQLHDILAEDYSRLLELIERRKVLGLKERDNAIFFHYLVALEAAVCKFLEILQKLYLKSDNHEDYSAREYKSDLHEYDKLVSEYSALGQDLNECLTHQ